jgi:hypothetical protein
MVQRRSRIYFTSKQKSEIWDRWQRGEPMSSIGRSFDRDSSSIYPLLSRTGGIRPPVRKRSRLALTLSEREEISRGIVGEQSIRSMALALGRSASTVSREVHRNGGYDQYRAAVADERAWDRTRRPKLCKLARSPWLRLSLSWALGLARSMARSRPNPPPFLLPLSLATTCMGAKTRRAAMVKVNAVIEKAWDVFLFFICLDLS